MYAVMFLITSLAVSYVESCGKNKRLYGCRTTSNENVCPHVEQRSCLTRSVICACKAGLLRNTNGKCVKRQDCTTPPEVIEEKKVKLSQENNETYHKALSVLQSHDQLHLLKISTETWQVMPCECLKSTFVQDLDTGARRSIDCYVSLTLPNNVKAMTRAYSNIDFEVTKDDSSTNVGLKSSLSGSAQLPFELQSSYQVLSAQETCIVLKTGEGADGRPHCMLWGLDNELPKDEHKCFYTIEKECVQETFQVWEHNDGCMVHDRLVEEYIRKTKETVEN
uniref:Putative secreted protein n=1 Tax=Amblyomma triste TaxID=251400 RepID=A0A023G6X8_AMBTT